MSIRLNVHIRPVYFRQLFQRSSRLVADRMRFVERNLAISINMHFNHQFWTCIIRNDMVDIFNPFNCLDSINKPLAQVFIRTGAGQIAHIFLDCCPNILENPKSNKQTSQRVKQR